MIFVVCLILGIEFCGYRPSAVDIVKEMFGLNEELMIFCWYIYFYIIVLLTIPSFEKVLRNGLIEAIVMGIFIPYIFFLGMGFLQDNSILQKIFYHLKVWYPCISFGYISSYYGIYEKTLTLIRKHIKFVSEQIIMIVLIFLVIIVCRTSEMLTFLWSGILVFALANLLQFNNRTRTYKILNILGKYSTNMYYLHCLFFSPITRDKFQRIIFWSESPIIICIWGILLLFLMSYVFSKLKYSVEYISEMVRRKI